MKTLFLLLLFLSVAFGQTQMEMDKQAGVEFEKVDAELNQIYKEIIHDYSGDTVFIKNLKEAESLWIKFRDAQVEMKYPSNLEGSILPMCRYYYLEELTSDRIKQLKPWVDGAEEGDGCSGSIKIK